MRVKLGLIGLGVVLAVAGFAAATLVAGASAHTDPCHPQHTCPSDHHSYVWTDPTTGLQWDCVEPGAREYDPILDVTIIEWDGRTYYCRAAGTTPPTTAPEPTSTQ